MAMRAITAALDTAATIEARPESYSFYNVEAIEAKTDNACLLGHIRFRMGMGDAELNAVAKKLGAACQVTFYERMSRLQRQGMKRLKKPLEEPGWRASGPVAAKYLRRYVAKWM